MNFTPQYPSLNMVLNEADKNAHKLKRSLDKQKSKSTFDLKAARRRGSSSKSSPSAPMHISSPLPPPYQEDAFGYQPLQACSPTRMNMDWGESHFSDDDQCCPSYYSRSFELDAVNQPMVPPSPTHVDAKSPAIVLELVVGHKLATKLQQKRHAKRQARLQDVHDAWDRLGLDTRKILAQGGQLPPHFWNPPQYDAEEMNRRLGRLCL